MDRAAFYLLWHAGLRVSEVEELRLEDLDFGDKKLIVRQGKGQKDRSVYMTAVVVSTLQAYLTMRGQGSSEHVFLYRNRALSKDLVRSRIKSAGKRVKVACTPHRLRHTCATQLLNAGCRVTSIQKFLGHKSLKATMVYARIHDHAVAEDYYTAMEQVEQRLALQTAPSAGEGNGNNGQEQMLTLVEQLSDPELEDDARLKLVDQMRSLLA